MTNNKEEKLKEIIFDDSYAFNELEAFKAEYGEDAAAVKEFTKAVKWYYDILVEYPSEMAMKYLKSLIERRTFTPIYNREEDWIQGHKGSDISMHKRRQSLVRCKLNGEYHYTDVEAVEIVDQNMKIVTDERLVSALALGMSSVEFPYMYSGKTIIFVAVYDTVAKVVSIRTPRGTTISVNRCYKLAKTIEEITEEEFVKGVAVDAGKKGLDALNSQN